MESNQDGLIYEVRDLYVEGRLDKVSFQISRNERLVLLGVNGAGKSTLLKVLAGLLTQYTGDIKFKGISLKSILTNKDLRKEFRKSVSIMLQEVSAMFFNPTVYDELAFSLRQLGYKEKRIKEKIDYLAERLDIKDILKKEPYNISGGEKKKVAFACCVIHKPDVLLLDEPTANMDPEGVNIMMDILSEMEVTVVTATHDISLISDLGNKVLILSKDHKVVYYGECNEHLHEFLKAASLLHKHRGKLYLNF